MKYFGVYTVLLALVLVDGGVVRQPIIPASANSAVIHEMINQQTARAMQAINTQLMTHRFPYTNLYYPYYPTFPRMTRKPLEGINDENNSTVYPVICIPGASCYEYHGVHQFGEIWVQKPQS